MITINDINTYLERNNFEHKSIMNEIDDLMYQARREENEENKIPSYLTKGRVKTADSIFLKTKREKDDNIEHIDDLIGLRVLCMFEQDIFKVYRFLISRLPDIGYNVYKIKVFNWDEEGDFYKKIKELAKEKNIKEEQKFKSSGYKSIHLLIKKKLNNNHLIEIQVRTLLQDVWGELEHSLVYKQGSIHPHIQKSFQLLARDLVTSDKLMSHLKTIKEKEEWGTKHNNSKTGPRHYFKYEKNLIPDNFLETNFENPPKDENDKEERNRFKRAKKEYEQYMSFIESSKDCEFIDYNEAVKLMSKIRKSFTAQEALTLNVNYWLKMEEAYLHFRNFEYDKAFSIYEELSREHEDKYVLHFRKGEIHFLNRDIDKALQEFDKSEMLINQNSTEYEIRNVFRIKSKIAYIYWYLGNEYIDLAIEKALDAEKILENPENINEFGEFSKPKLNNSLCWYYLEKYWSTSNALCYEKRAEKVEIFKNQQSDAFENKTKYFKIIEPFSTNKEISSNLIDTIAVVYFEYYKLNRKKDDLQKAQKYAQQIEQHKNYNMATYSSLSEAMHNNHIYEILSYSEDNDIGEF